MLKKVLALFLLLSIIPTVSATCSKYTHVLTSDYESDLLYFYGLDFDENKGGNQDSTHSDPSGLITMLIDAEWGPSCKGCRVNINAFGDWTESELAKILSGIKGESGYIYSPISFRAPNEPGNYTVRVIFLIGQEGFAQSFDTGKSCIGCEGECHIFYADATIIVLKPLSNDTISPSVKITSPDLKSVLDRGEIAIGEVVLVDAQVSDPLANISLRITDNEVAGFPYLWNTSNFTKGEYVIEVTAVDLAGNIGSDQITVELIEKSGLLKPSLVWSHEESHPLEHLDISRDGSLISAASTNFAKVYDVDGNEIAKYDLAGVVSGVALSGDGGLVVAGAGNRVLLLRDGSIVWS